jgi:hypothetical protein
MTDTHSGIFAKLPARWRRTGQMAAGERASQNRRESPALTSMSDSSAALPFRSPPILGAYRFRKITLITWIGFDPVGPAAKPSALKADEITLITWTRSDPVGAAAARSAIKTGENTLIARIRLDSVGVATAPSAVKTDENTLIARIRLDSVGAATAPPAVKTDEITLITWIRFEPVGPALALRASGRRASDLSGLDTFDGLSPTPYPSPFSRRAKR